MKNDKFEHTFSIEIHQCFKNIPIKCLKKTKLITHRMNVQNYGHSKDNFNEKEMVLINDTRR